MIPLNDLAAEIGNPLDHHDRCPTKASHTRESESGVGMLDAA